MSKEMLLIDRVSGGYHKKDIIKDVTLSIDTGDFVGIIGPNGAGKSTLMRLCTRILRPSHGNIFFQGNKTDTMDLNDFCRKVAVVSSDITTNFSFTVMELALMGRIPHLGRLQFETKRDHEIAHYALALTDTTHVRDRSIDELSAGERQRAAVAKALAQEPILLFLDEPTAHLDIGHQIQIMDLLRKLNRERNLTIVAVLHDLNLASEYCNRIALLHEGKLFTQGNPEKVLTYQNIEAVYNTIVVVEENPINKKPYVILVSKKII